jgi:hypothetical protein
MIEEETALDLTTLKWMVERLENGGTGPLVSPMKPLRPSTTIPVKVVDELWVVKTTDGWVLERPSVADHYTGEGKPGAAAVKPSRILKPGTKISVVFSS